MKTVGIIAEYNPFHNGHAYQIKKIKEQTGADFVVVAMSGDFVQRGAPAIMDKYARTQMALRCGADLVIELPVLWATSSAESFAMAGVTLFDKLGCADGICFGAETDNLDLLSAIADFLIDEPDDYRLALSVNLKNGDNFASARAKAFLSAAPLFFPHHAKHFPSAISQSALTEILSSPNNILAIEYLKAIRRRNSNLKPFLLKREGSGYHDSSIAIPVLDTGAVADSPIVSKNICASATAIRRLLLDCSIAVSSENTVPSDYLKFLSAAMPDVAVDILTEYEKNHSFLTEDDFSLLLAYRLLSETEHGFSRFADAAPDMANRIQNNRQQFFSFSQFCELCKSRDITYTRMSRVLLHILLNLTTETAALGKKLDYIPYFRLLGFCKKSAALLTLIKQCSDTPMLSKLADAKKILTPDAFALLQTDIHAAELYELVLSQKQHPLQQPAHFVSGSEAKQKRTFPRSEYTRGIVLL